MTGRMKLNILTTASPVFQPSVILLVILARSPLFVLY